MHLLPKLVCIVLVVALATVAAQDNNETATTEAPPEAADTNAPATNADEAATSATDAPAAEETTSDPAAAVTDNAGATKENATAEESNTTEPTSEPSTTPSPSASTMAPAMPKGVSQACLELYHNCTQQNDAGKKYCDALMAAKTCIEAEDQNTTQACTTEEHERLVLLDCGPVTLFQNSSVSNACLARISECLSTARDVNKLTKAYTFGKFFCDEADSSESCLKTEEAGSICTSEEHDTLLKEAECSSARALIGSTMLIALLCLMQRIFGGY